MKIGLQKGFTIIELLIVIVVIAILASISTVAYNGIQDRVQFASVKSDANDLSKLLSLYEVDHGNYPNSVTDCPNPSNVNICFRPSDDHTVHYRVVPAGGSGYTIVSEASYEFAVMSDRQFYFSSPSEITSTSEFMRYTDLVSYIDRYGLQEYRLTFDIKSADTTNRTWTNVYMQSNGGPKYTAGVGMDISTNYSRKSIVFEPVLRDSAAPRSDLSVFGTYSTGNIPMIKNLTIHLE